MWNKLFKSWNLGDRFFYWALSFPGLLLVVTLFAIAFDLLLSSLPILKKIGFQFFYGTAWNPVTHDYGALPVIFGTIIASVLALTIAAPIGIGIALCLTEIFPRKLSQITGFLIEMLAAIPSVIYGLWGIFVLAPILRIYIEPFLSRYLGFLPFFQGIPYGIGILAAVLILSIMILPTIASLSREIFRAVPDLYREAALALGATKWEMIHLSVISSSRKGIFGALILALGRALGETMAVTMVIGNRHSISASLFAPASTMASKIANEYAEATDDLHLSALAAIGLSLFVITFFINALAKLVLLRGRD